MGLTQRASDWKKLGRPCWLLRISPGLRSGRWARPGAPAPGPLKRPGGRDQHEACDVGAAQGEVARE
eukprot:7441973-Alexandrium_andersonii.AAC.1